MASHRFEDDDCAMTNLDDLRHAAQAALLAAGTPLQFGTADWTALPDDLAAAAADADHPAWIDGGLTARVRRVARGDGPAVALKVARAECLVRNRDGQRSFLNELQRRRELHDLAERGQGIAGITPTLHASLHEGVLVSPWIEGGEPVTAWSERSIAQLFDTGVALLLAGLFEWDFSPGNLLDDGRRLWLFDFGYMYPFDPLRHFNTAGDGSSAPQFHLAERFETRCFFGHLLALQAQRGDAAALAVFRLEKEIALACYQRLRATLAQRGASTAVLAHYDAVISQWRDALRGDLAALYLREGWRSHDADLDDDLRGRTCTPMTLRRASWLIDQARDHYDALRAAGALDHQPGGAPTREALLARLAHDHGRAVRWQVAARPG